MKLVTRATFAEMAYVSRAAITKAIREKRLDIVEGGKTGRIDPECYKSIQFLKASNIQRSTPGRLPVQKKSVPPKKPKPKQKKKPVPSGKILTFPSGAKTPKKKPDPKPASKPKIKPGKELQTAGPKPLTPEEIESEKELDRKIEILEDLGNRYDQARTEKLEQQAINEKLKNARIRGELVDREKVYNNMFTYLDKLHSNFERLADSYLSDIGPLMIDAGKVMPEHRSAWKNEVLSQIDEAKTGMVKMLKKIQREQTK